MKIQTPYFTIQHLLREFAKGLGTKSLAAKEIDDACKDNEITPQQLAKLKSQLVHEPLTKYVNLSFADHFMGQIDKVFEQYLNLMKSTPLDGVDASKAQAVINKYFMSFSVANICASCLGGMKTTPQAIALSGRTMFDYTFDKLRRDTEWREFEDKCTKEQKDRFRIWSLAEEGELPDITSIAALGEQWRPGNSWGAYKARLITARFWDYFFYRDGSCDLDMIRLVEPRKFEFSIKQPLVDLLHKDTVRYKNTSLMGLDLWRILRLRQPKTLQDKAYCQKSLPELKGLFDKLDVNNEANYFYYWMLARFHLHQGYLDDALDNYKLAFERVIYRQGENADSIIQEAIIVACRTVKPDKVFINRLRRMAVIFGIDVMPSGTVKPEGKKKYEDIESWEISAFAKYFSSYFKEESFFPGATYPPLVQPNYGIWLIDEAEYTLDLRRPNKNFKVGTDGGLIKKMPQVVYFSMQNNVDVVKQLVEAGADINKLSESGESALLFSILEMDTTDFSVKSMSQALFDYIASLVHTAECLNTKTLKRNLTPLGCAIETGRLDVVRKVITLGANVETRYSRDMQTPLHGVIGLIAKHTRPEVIRKQIEEFKYSDKSLQGIRAYGAGLVPQDLEQLRKQLVDKEDDPLWQSIEQVGLELILGNVQKYTTVAELRDIALFLIEKRGNPNAKHNNTALQDFTPFMLAAEHNEAEIFKAMRSAGGDMRSSCFDQKEQRRAGLREIVYRWRSKDIATLLS